MRLASRQSRRMRDTMRWNDKEGASCDDGNTESLVKHTEEGTALREHRPAWSYRSSLTHLRTVPPSNCVVPILLLKVLEGSASIWASASFHCHWALAQLRTVPPRHCIISVRSLKVLKWSASVWASAAAIWRLGIRSDHPKQECLCALH